VLVMLQACSVAALAGAANATLQHHGEHAGLYQRWAIQVGVEWESAPRY
jgi:hypothetical protein